MNTTKRKTYCETCGKPIMTSASNPRSTCSECSNDPAAELRLSAEFEREMLALVPNPIDDGEVEDIRGATEYGYDRYAKGGV